MQRTPASCSEVRAFALEVVTLGTSIADVVERVLENPSSHASSETPSPT